MSQRFMLYTNQWRFSSQHERCKLCHEVHGGNIENRDNDKLKVSIPVLVIYTSIKVNNDTMHDENKHGKVSEFQRCMSSPSLVHWQIDAIDMLVHGLKCSEIMREHKLDEFIQMLCY